jgi:hypothetical protein
MQQLCMAKAYTYANTYVPLTPAITHYPNPHLCLVYVTAPKWAK